jgi:peptidoglycan/LPS O-acetylase OafA/YrhL
MLCFRPNARREATLRGRPPTASAPDPQLSVAPDQRTRIKSLDGIRAVSILAVFGYHSLVPHMRGGWLGVEAFFVLSGYLITTLLLGEHSRTGHVKLKRFWAHRLLRLWPALIVMVIVVAPTYRLGPFAWQSLGAYVGSATQVVLYVWDLSLTYFGGNAGFIGHTWTLGVEMYFYILWPLLLLRLLRNRSQRIVPILICLCATSIIATVIHLATNPAGQLGYYAPYTQALPLLIGCLLAIIRHDGLLPALHPRWGSALAALGLSGLVALIFASSQIDGSNFYTPLLLATASVVLLLLGMQINPTCAVARLLSVKPLAALGLISYSFYLYQSPIIFTIGSDIHGALRVPSLLVITAGCATLSYLCVERRFLRLRRRFNQPQARRHPAQRTTPVLGAADPIASAGANQSR